MVRKNVYEFRMETTTHVIHTANNKVFDADYHTYRLHQ